MGLALTIAKLANKNIKNMSDELDKAESVITRVKKNKQIYTQAELTVFVVEYFKTVKGIIDKYDEIAINDEMLKVFVDSVLDNMKKEIQLLKK